MDIYPEDLVEGLGNEPVKPPMSAMVSGGVRTTAQSLDTGIDIDPVELLKEMPALPPTTMEWLGQKGKAVLGGMGDAASTVGRGALDAGAWSIKEARKYAQNRLYGRLGFYGAVATVPSAIVGGWAGAVSTPPGEHKPIQDMSPEEVDAMLQYRMGIMEKVAGAPLALLPEESAKFAEALLTPVDWMMSGIRWVADRPGRAIVEMGGSPTAAATVATAAEAAIIFGSPALLSGAIRPRIRKFNIKRLEREVASLKKQVVAEVAAKADRVSKQQMEKYGGNAEAVVDAMIEEKLADFQGEAPADTGMTGVDVRRSVPGETPMPETPVDFMQGVVAQRLGIESRGTKNGVFAWYDPVEGVEFSTPGLDLDVFKIKGPDATKLQNAALAKATADVEGVLESARASVRGKVFGQEPAGEMWIDESALGEEGGVAADTTPPKYPPRFTTRSGGELVEDIPAPPKVVPPAERVTASPSYTWEMKPGEVTQYYKVKGGPHDGSDLTLEQLKEMGIEVVEGEKPPAPPSDAVPSEGNLFTDTMRTETPPDTLNMPPERTVAEVEAFKAGLTKPFVEDIISGSPITAFRVRPGGMAEWTSKGPKVTMTRKGKTEGKVTQLSPVEKPKGGTYAIENAGYIIDGFDEMSGKWTWFETAANHIEAQRLLQKWQKQLKAAGPKLSVVPPRSSDGISTSPEALTPPGPPLARAATEEAWQAEVPKPAAGPTTTLPALSPEQLTAGFGAPLAGTIWRSGGPHGKFGTFGWLTDVDYRGQSLATASQGFRQYTINLKNAFHIDATKYAGLEAEAIWDRFAPESVKAKLLRAYTKYDAKAGDALTQVMDGFAEKWAREHSYDGVVYYLNGKPSIVQLAKGTEARVAPPMVGPIATEALQSAASREYGRPKALTGHSALLEAMEEVLARKDAKATEKAVGKVSPPVENIVAERTAKKARIVAKHAEEAVPPEPKPPTTVKVAPELQKHLDRVAEDLGVEFIERTKEGFRWRDDRTGIDFVTEYPDEGSVQRAIDRIIDALDEPEDVHVGARDVSQAMREAEAAGVRLSAESEALSIAELDQLAAHYGVVEDPPPLPPVKSVKKGDIIQGLGIVDKIEPNKTGRDLLITIVDETGKETMLIPANALMSVIKGEVPPGTITMDMFGTQSAFDFFHRAISNYRLRRYARVRPAIEAMLDEGLKPASDNMYDVAGSKYLRTGDFDALVAGLPSSPGKLSAKALLKILPQLGQGPKGIATITLPTGKSMILLRQSGAHTINDFIQGLLDKEGKVKYKDISRTVEKTTTPTQMMETIDMGHFGGPVSTYVLYPQRTLTKGKLLWIDKQKARFGKIIDDNNINNGRLRKTLTVVLEQVDTATAALPVDVIRTKVMKDPIVRQAFEKLSNVQKEHVISAAKETRTLLNDLLDDQNKVRVKLGRKPIPYTQAYASWMKTSSQWSRYWGMIKQEPWIRDYLTNKPLGPDFLNPGQPVVPHALRRSAEPKYTREMNATRIIADYIDAAGRDIFDTLIIQNNKVHIAALRGLGLENAANAIQTWTNEVFAGVAPKITQVAMSTLAYPVRQGIMGIRKGLTRSVFPMNIPWNLMVQPSSAVFTYLRYGPRSTLAGLRYFFDPAFRQAIEQISYSSIIKARFGGNLAYQDTAASIMTYKRLQVGPLARFNDMVSLVTRDMENALTGHANAAAYDYGYRVLGLRGRKLWEFTSDGGAKTQSMYNYEDSVGLLRAKEVGALVPFQPFVFEAFNTVRELNLPVINRFVGKIGAYETMSARSVEGSAELFRRLRMVSRLVAGMYVTDSVVYQVSGRHIWEPTSFLPFSSTYMPSERFDTHFLLPAEYAWEFYKGAYDIIAYDSWTKMWQWGLRYHPTGGTPVGRLITGIIAADKGAQLDVRGRRMYPIRGDAEKARAIAFGPSATLAGRKYKEKRQKYTGISGAFRRREARKGGGSGRGERSSR